MKLISKMSKFLKSLSFVLENPTLIKVKKIGGMPTLFKELDQEWFHKLGISTIIDIGANTGQFALTMNNLLPNASIYSFEPIPECFNQLSDRMSGVKNFTGFNIGLGDVSGRLEFEANSFSPSSSFLKMTSLHETLYPFTADKVLMNVPIERLDDVLDVKTLQTPMLVKLDVQGYELKVIEGGSQLIRNAKMVIIEVGFAVFYEGQPLFDDIYRVFTSLGFRYAGSIEQVHHPENKSILYADVVFIKN
jgi:FkbM family methyltransferase